MSRTDRLVAWLCMFTVAVPAFAQGAKAPVQGTTKEQRIMALARGIYRLTSLGDSAVLTARIFGDNFRVISNEAIAWRSEDAGIAESAPTGAITAIGNGTTKVWAVAGKDSVFAVVIVEQRAAKLAFTPSTLILNALGAVAPVRAEQRDARGNPVKGDYAINVGCKLRDNGVVAGLQAGGKIVARQTGATALVCTRSGLKDSLPIVVRQETFAAKITPSENVNLAQAGDTLRLKVTAYDRLAKPIVDVRAGWAAVDTAIVEVDPMNGIVLGKAQGDGRVAARIEGVTDTITVHVLGPLPEGKTLMHLVASRPPAPAPVAAAPAAAAPMGTSAPVGGAGLAIGAVPSASLPSSTGSSVTRGRVAAPMAPRASSRSAALPTGLGLATVASDAADSAAIHAILSGGVQTTNARAGRTYVITPIVMLAEYRFNNPSPPDSTHVTTTGTVIGIEAEVLLYGSFFARGHYATGTMVAGGALASTQYDVTSFGDMAIDVGYRALPWLSFTAGYGNRGVTRLVSGYQGWTMLRVGAQTDLSMVSDHVRATVGLTFMPSVTVTSQTTVTTAGTPPVAVTPFTVTSSTSASSSLGGIAGVSYRVGWFTAGVEYNVESFEFSKRPADAAASRPADLTAREDRFSSLRIKLGVHFGK